MRRFLASAWFPFATVLLLAVVTAAAFALMKSSFVAVPSDFALPLTIAGWASGVVTAALSFLLIGILNLVRRIAKLRRKTVLHAPVVFLGVLPWMIFAWEIVMNEPRHTELAIVVIDFIGKPMFIGAFITCIFVLLMFLLTLVLPKKSR